MFDKVCIILQGCAINSLQLENVIDYYKDIGLNNIVISSYKYCINKNISDNYPVILNDDSIVGKIKNQTTSRGLYIYSDDKIPFIPNNTTNYHILTTKRGINLAQQYHKECDFYLKHRADQKLLSLNKHMQSWIKNTTVVNDDIFKYKLTAFAWGLWNKPVAWRIIDYWMFGYKDDIINYYNIDYATSKILTSSPECYLARTYIASKIKEPDFNICKDLYFNFDNTIEIYWYKYNRIMNKEISCKLT